MKSCKPNQQQRRKAQANVEECRASSDSRLVRCGERELVMIVVTLWLARSNMSIRIALSQRASVNDRQVLACSEDSACSIATSGPLGTRIRAENVTAPREQRTARLSFSKIFGSCGSRRDEFSFTERRCWVFRRCLVCQSVWSFSPSAGRALYIGLVSYSRKRWFS